ncbi:hypothetical protein V7S76_05275 [Aquirufa sp. ROCK2-A2]
MKYLLLIVLMTFNLPNETLASSKNSTVHYSPNNFKKANKVRKKRGFLWGLFKKKSCDCPKH